jgi:hypothetical protein
MKVVRTILALLTQLLIVKPMLSAIVSSASNYWNLYLKEQAYLRPNHYYDQTQALGVEFDRTKEEGRYQVITPFDSLKAFTNKVDIEEGDTLLLYAQTSKLHVVVTQTEDS